MADNQQVVKMAAVGQRCGEFADAAGKILKAFAVGGGHVLPVSTPRGIVFRILSLKVAMMTHLPVAEKHFIERGMALTRIWRSPSSRSAVVPVLASSLQMTLSKGTARSRSPSARAWATPRGVRGVGAWPLYNPATLASVSPWRTNHNFMMMLRQAVETWRYDSAFLASGPVRGQQ